ncbi:MAG: radical SAM family heme chaperone HemW [Pyrinomonadaceae bacterium]
MKAGVYLHIPFCKSRCSYCDFATDVYKNEETVERYVDAVIREISDFGFRISDPRSEIQNPKPEIDTVYFGGGTPSLLKPEQLEKILRAVRQKFSAAEDAEITLEMNPGTVSPEKLSDYRSLGVNRASFGVQTFDERALRLLARGHDATDARRTFEMLRRAGFDNISFDLIAGLPHQTLDDWRRNLEEALRLGPEHLSLYLLEIHEGTPLAEQIRSGRRPLPDEDLAGEMYQLMLKEVTARGYLQYEISNFSLSGRESRHNSKYWLGHPVFAFGVSAHSFDGVGTRRANERDTARYVALIESGESPVVEITELDPDARRGEYIFLRLRLNRGLDLEKFERKFGFDLTERYGAELAELSEAGLIGIDRKHLRLTDRGRLFSNEVFSLFI